MDHQLADAGRGHHRTVRTRPERVRRRYPCKLDQLCRTLGHLDQAIREPLLEPKLAQRPNQRPQAVAELLENQADRVGPIAQHQQHSRLLNSDQSQVAVASADRPSAADLEGHAGRVEADSRRLERGVGTGRSGLTMDLDGLERARGPLADLRTAALLPDVAGVTAAGPRPTQVASVVTGRRVQAKRAGESLELAWVEAAA